MFIIVFINKYTMFDFFSFFFDNKSGWKTNEKILSNKYPEIYNEIKIFSEKNSLTQLKFQQQIWHFLYKYNKIPKCAECQKDLKFKRSLKEGYGVYCSLSCTNKNKNHIEKSKESWLLNKDSIIQKIKKTNMEIYGVENIFEDKEKIKKSIIKKYNVSHISKLPEINEKRKRTFLEKYNCTSNFKRDDIRKKNIDSKQLNFLDKNINFNFINFTGSTLSLICSQCYNEYDISRVLFRHRIMFNKNPCTKCVPINSSDSFYEKEIYEYIKSIYDGIILENDRNIISPKELDIFLPDKKIGIEFNGLFWHSSKYVDNTYHLKKMNSCRLENIDLIQIFEDEWVYKKEIVKSIINYKLKNSINTIYGRKCIVKEIDSKTYKLFCDKNHIQGYVNAKYKIGLFYNDELVSIMSFGELRKSLGSKKEKDTYELLRYCSKLNTTIIGGVSKLFKYFLDKVNPNKIISFSDNRYFNGDLYQKLNFKFNKETKPNYFYITDYLKRENRFKFRKDVLVSEGFDSNKTEFEIMDERKIYRIWDCGNKKWVWEK